MTKITDLSPEIIKARVNVSVNEALECLAGAKKLTARLIELGVSIKQSSVTHIGQAHAAKNALIGELDLIGKQLVESMDGITLSIKANDYFEWPKQSFYGLDHKDMNAGKIVENQLNAINFEEVYSNLVTVHSGLKSKQNKANQEQIKKAANILFATLNLDEAHKTTKAGVNVTPTFIMSKNSKVGYSVDSCYKTLSIINAHLPEIVCNKPMMDLISLYNDCSFDQSITPQTIMGTKDLSIKVFKTKNVLIFSKDAFNTIAAFVSMYADEDKQRKVMVAMQKITA